MKKFAIVTDSTTYFTEEEFAKFGIKRASLNVIKGEETFKELYIDNAFVDQQLTEGHRLSTSQPSPGDYLDIYEELLTEGYEKIFVLVIAETLSGTFQSASLASKMVDNPDKIHIFNSNMAAFGNENLLYQLVSMIKEDKSYEEIVERMENLFTTTGLLFTVENLTALKRSGRLSRAKALVGSVLRVKPIIEMDHGKLDLYKVARTSKKVLTLMIDDMKKKIKDYKKLFIRIVNHNSPEIIEELKNKLKETFQNIELTITDYIGPVFNVHLGTKGYGVTWMYE